MIFEFRGVMSCDLRCIANYFMILSHSHFSLIWLMSPLRIAYEMWVSVTRESLVHTALSISYRNQNKEILKPVDYLHFHSFPNKLQNSTKSETCSFDDVCFPSVWRCFNQQPHSSLKTWSFHETGSCNWQILTKGCKWSKEPSCTWCRQTEHTTQVLM